MPIAAAGLLLLVQAPAHADGTPAGTAIRNVASITYQQQGDSHQADSNPAIVTIAEELGIELRWDDQTPITIGASGATAVPFTLINRGNGHEAFVLDGSFQGIDATLDGFSIATSSGAQPTQADLPRGGQTAELAPGQSLHLFAFVRGHTAGRGTLTVEAHALTGFGKPGTTFPQRGDGGGDAVVGATTAQATIARALTATDGGGTTEPTVALDKQQTVTAPDGTSNPVHGALILYTLAAHVSGQGSALGAVVVDPIPDGTDYVPGSLTLDGKSLPDNGNFDSAGVAVPLGDVASGDAHTITFQVKIR